jgi:hypothetical protein
MSFRSFYRIGFSGALFSGVLITTLSAVAFADDSAGRIKLVGTWQAQADGGGVTNAVWVLEDKGDAFHIVNSQGDKKIADFTCALAKECEVKDGGRKVKVTLYFNGAKLVVTETKGDEVVKRRFGAEEKGDVLDVEVIPVVPDGKTETLHFKRLANATSVTASTK